MTDYEEKIRQRAVELYGSDDVQIDHTLDIDDSPDEGVWVPALVWVPVDDDE